MPLLASLSAFGYYNGCVDCRLSPIACDILSVHVLSTSVECIFSLSMQRNIEGKRNRLVDHARNTFKKEQADSSLSKNQALII